MKKFKNDKEAWEYLEKRGFTEERFIIDIPDVLKLSKKEFYALYYLIQEWDWGYKELKEINKNE